MKKNYFALLFALMGLAGKGVAQNSACGTDEIHRQMLKEHPELVQAEQDYERQIAEGLKKIDFKALHKTTFVDQSGNENFWYDIPIVVHVIHNYGAEYLSDNAIYNALVNWNIIYAKQNPDTATVIPTFVKYIGNPHIRLHLATKDPNGNPTHGITRHRNYLTYTGSEYAKFEDWQPTSYLNIWSVNVIGGRVAAFAHFPSDVSGIPFWDGVIGIYDYMDSPPNSTKKVINHEIAHCLSIAHTWGTTNDPAVACGDDNVDDTPPTKGHDGGGCTYTAGYIYDTTCARNYFKIYVTTHGTDSLVNYPDTANSQNIMDYTDCDRMFTKGQSARMHVALNSSVGGRNNLWTLQNLYFTGVMSDTIAGTFVPRLDLKPIPEFSATLLTPSAGRYMSSVGYFTFPNTSVTFNNMTWNDTVTKLVWNFSNNSANPTYSSDAHTNAISNFTNTFADPGWVDIKMTATGNHTGDTTVDFPRSVFVADAAGTPTASYFQNFDGADTAKWPFFNYFNNEFQWKWANVGYADNNSIMYKGFDDRLSNFSSPTTGQPLGDFDDFFSVPMDLSGYAGSCSINYFYSGATRTSNSIDMNDTLEIAYSVGKSQTWTKLAGLSKGQIANKGAVGEAWVPTNPSDWAQMSLDVPAAAKTPYTVFRFRYRPSVGSKWDGSKVVWPGTTSSGNNFYMDRLFFSPFPAGVANVLLDNMDVAVAPNPTTGDAYVIVKDVEYGVANVVVSDITGKVVYKTSASVSGSETRILIPQAAISVSGMYIVQTSTGSQVRTQKLVVQ